MKWRQILAAALSCAVLPFASLPAAAESIWQDYEGMFSYMVHEDHAVIGFAKHDVEHIVIPAELEGVPVTQLCDNSFAQCTSLVSVELPDTIEVINRMAFDGCHSLQSVRLPAGLREVRSNAFSSCTNLEALALPDTLETIGVGAFYQCKTLEEVAIPESVHTIEYGAFSGCSSLKTVTIPESVTYFGRQVFRDTAWLTEQRAEAPLVIVNNILLDGATCSGSVTIPEGVTAIAGGAFFNDEKLTGVTIPEGVTYIDVAAFQSCTALKSVTIPASVERIGTTAFVDNQSLKKVTILNPNCVLEQELGYPTFGSYMDFPYSGTICGYDGSTAQTYAKENGCGFSSLGESPIPIWVKGDVDGDGEVSVIDAVMLQKWLLSATDKMDCPQNADLCKDGSIDTYDLSLLKRIIVAK